LMGDIAAIISIEGINILNANLRVSQSFATINLVLEINNLEQLSRILTRIENLPNVMETHRVKPG
jgi:GTP diphosphokinase / guanosine-3',5'-bis(diphosphate) 3'-diphosphatase